MQRSRIEWTDWTWNPVTGCENKCSYCYARKISHRFKRSFKPTFHPERLSTKEMNQPRPGDKVFVCSMGELFGPWIQVRTISTILKQVVLRPDVTFQFLTKFPGRYDLFKWPPNCWLGVTITGQEPTDIQGRMIWDILRIQSVPVRFISYEPFLDPVLEIDSSDAPNALRPPDWQIIGAQTNPTVQPKREWVQRLLDSGVPTFLKDSLKWPEKIRAWPGDQL